MSNLRERIIRDLKEKQAANRKALDAALKPREFPKLPRTIQELRNLPSEDIRTLMMSPLKPKIEAMIAAENARAERQARIAQFEQDKKQEELEKEMGLRISGEYNHD